MSSPEHKQYARKILSISKSRLAGLILVLGFFAGFGYWAATAPLMGAVVAPGWIIKEGRTQSITHEHGGVVSKIFVSEGERVEEGEILALIEDSERTAEKEKIETKIAYLTIKEARLVAEERKDDFDAELALKEAGVDEAGFLHTQFVQDQVKEFNARRQLVEQQEAVYIKQKRTLEEELRGLLPEVDVMRNWRDILAEQVEMRGMLLEKGAVSKVEWQETKKDFNEVEAEYLSKKSRSETLPFNVAEVDARLDSMAINFQKDVVQELSEVRSEKLTLEKSLRAALRVMARVELKAPTSGTIDKVHINTIGSAVAAFQAIIDIVPENNPILVEVEVSPTDVEQIKIDQQAKLILAAYDPSEVEPVGAKVKFVSPDRRVNERTLMPYFVVRLEIQEEKAQEMPPIVPGMPIEAYIETAPRTFLQLLIDPLTKSIRRSFRS